MNLLRGTRGGRDPKEKTSNTLNDILIYIGYFGFLLLLMYGAEAFLDCPEGDTECELAARNGGHIPKLLYILAKLFS